ncbi:HAD family hydrolase [Nonomuraea soli]|uniref:HAD superfamily hydrolase (TIGR01549 family) n=1 Tax=Nonomuraea soli TaxID=1032476 RepID=A0A7W0CSI1_9ACTN|nr:HAD family hydrolase [Nonomuraea soli]MBA2896384.1 HAD superfamily hydrolase (TIGR01549 family) [Nonomuraea soli]
MKALLLDFGGVLVQTSKRPSWAAELAKEVHQRLARAGFGGLEAEEIEVDIRAGADADRYWKDAMSRLAAPVEMTHRGFWGDFVASDWPAAARELVRAEASALCRRMGELRQERVVRPGMRALLERCQVPVAVVSNALCGAVHRDFLAAAGVEVALQVYSDEVGVRKPNPEMIWIATRALGVDPSQVWYVGDNYDRDGLCGVRAGVGTTVIMRSDSTDTIPYRVRQRPSAVVDDAAGLLRLMEAS